MRFLIFTGAILAYASAAPSVAFLSALTPTAVYLPTAPVTVSPGDLQAAIIDANVQAQDFIRASADRNRELAEQAVEIQKERANEVIEQAKLRAEQALWNSEEHKWQTLKASQVSQAKLESEAAKLEGEAAKLENEAVKLQGEAEAAKNAEVLVKSTLISPIVPSIPIVYATPGIIAPEAKPSEEVKEDATSEVSSDQSSQAADSKTGNAEESKPVEEPEKAPEATSSAQTSSAGVVDAAPILKTTIVGDQSIVTQSLIQAHPPYVAVSYFSPSLKISDPLISTPVAFVHPGTNFFSSSVIHTPGQLPTVVKTVW